MTPPCATCGATTEQRVCPHDARGVLGVDVKDLASVLAENARLRQQVASLQEGQTKLVNERRQSRRARVREFHAKMGQFIGEVPRVPDDETVRFRAKFIVEEVFETLRAMFPDGPVTAGLTKLGIGLSGIEDELVFVIQHAKVQVDMEELADGLEDIEYVTTGTAIVFGINGDPVADAVHAANMLKEQGGDKKAYKPPGWKKPDIRAILLAQGWVPPPDDPHKETPP